MNIFFFFLDLKKPLPEGASGYAGNNAFRFHFLQYNCKNFLIYKIEDSLEEEYAIKIYEIPFLITIRYKEGNGGNVGIFFTTKDSRMEKYIAKASFIFYSQALEIGKEIGEAEQPPVMKRGTKNGIDIGYDKYWTHDEYEKHINGKNEIYIATTFGLTLIN